MVSQFEDHQKIDLPTKNGETSITVPIYPGSHRAIIKSSNVPFFIGETDSFGITTINSTNKRDHVYEIIKGEHLIIKKNDIHKSLHVEINFI